MTKAALLIVDVQSGFINEATSHIPNIVENILGEYPLTIATKFFNKEGSNFRKLIEWNEMGRYSNGFSLAFNPLPSTVVIEKSGYTCVNKAFLDLIKREQISEIHICGIDTDICVTKCAVDIFENGLTPFVLINACASTAGKVYHNAALQILPRYIGEKQLISSR